MNIAFVREILPRLSGRFMGLGHEWVKLTRGILRGCCYDTKFTAVKSSLPLALYSYAVHCGAGYYHIILQSFIDSPF